LEVGRPETEVRKTWDRIPTTELVEMEGWKSEDRRPKLEKLGTEYRPLSLSKWGWVRRLETEERSKKKEVKIAVSLSPVCTGSKAGIKIKSEDRRQKLEVR
jgi:hypothetical protein